MTDVRPFLVPATLQRLRCFLDTEAGLRIRPWAGVDEILDAFHDALRSHRRDAAFWDRLGELLAALVEDVRRRESGGAFAALDGEVLDTGRRAAVLDEIRTVLEGRRRGSGRFRRLARALSAPALAMLTVLAGAATVGCYSSYAEEENLVFDAAHETDGGSDVPTDAVPEDTSDAPPDLPRDDARADADDDAAADADGDCDAVGSTLAEIVETCLPGDEEWRVRYREEVLACVAALHSSWRTGLMEMFRCEDCWTVQDRIGTCLMDGYARVCDAPADAGTFDEEAFLDNCALYVYLGVRFE